MCNTAERTVELTRKAKEMLEGIADKSSRKKIASGIDKLKKNAHLQGKDLRGNLAGYRSVRATQRFRIIFKVATDKVTVRAVGLRKGGDKNDVYELCDKLWRDGEL